MDNYFFNPHLDPLGLHPPAKNLLTIHLVLLNDGLLLGVVSDKPAIAKHYAFKAQMGKPEAEIGLSPPGWTGFGQTLLGPEPPLIFPVIPSSLFRVFVGQNMLLPVENLSSTWRQLILLG
jgi:hypothetical protein